MIIEVDGEGFNTETCQFNGDDFEFIRYLKGKYRSNYERFINRLIRPMIKKFKKFGLDNLIPLMVSYAQNWNNVEPFTYKEAFNISNDQFRALVFSSINITEMINELGSHRLKTEGIELVNRKYNVVTNSFVEENYSYVAELHSVNGEKLGISESIYVIKVWCTSTNKEHWLWVDETNCDINSPLDAVASTCRIYKSMIGKIKHIIRQGDVYLFEMNEEVDINPKNDKIVRLSKEDYFTLLKSQA